MNAEAQIQKMADEGASYTLCDPRSKAVTYPRWQHKPNRSDAAIAHLRNGGNVGLLVGELSNWLIALDLDQQAPEFQKQHPLLCGWRVWRQNALQRAKYIVRCIGAHNRKDHVHGLEVLGFGNAVIAGVHESGAPILMELAGDVPQLTGEELGAIFNAWTGKPYGKSAKAPRPKGFAPLEVAPAGAVFTVRMLLDHIAPRRADDYNEWVRVGIAVKHECGPGGFGLWDAWSRSSSKYDADECRTKWESLHPDGRVTLRTLRYLAQTDGLQ